MKSEGLTASLLTDVHKVFVSFANSDGERDKRRGRVREGYRRRRVESLLFQWTTKSFKSRVLNIGLADEGA